MFALLATLFVLSFAAPLSAQEGQRLLIDPKLSMPSGVATVQGVRYLVGEAQDRILPSSLGPENGFGPKVGNILYRTLKLSLVDGPLDLLEEVVLHEVWGHGARARELGFSVSYEIGAPPPFGSSGGATVFEPPFRVGIELSAHERLAILAGGVEASGISQRRLASRWVARGTFNYREALRFVNTTLSAVNNTLISVTSDGGKYWVLADSAYYPGTPTRVIDQNTIEGRAMIHLANPVLIASLYRVLWSHLVQGRDDYDAPMISFGAARWIGWPEYVLSPFGPEWGMQHLIGTAGRVWRVTARVNDGLTDQSSRAVGVGVNRVVDGPSLDVGARVEVWDQPGLELLANGPAQRSGGAGALVSMDLSWAPEPARRARFPWSIVAEIGYKTAGFVPGERLDRGVIIRIGGGF